MSNYVLLIFVSIIFTYSSALTSNVSKYPPLPSDIDGALSSAPLGRVDHQTVLKAWSLFSQRAPFWIGDLVSKANNTLQEIIPKTNVSRTCHQSLQDLLISIQSMDDWAMRLIDSWGKFPMAGIMDGTFTDFGSFDECLSIKPNDVIGEPMYCSLEMRPLLPPRPRFHNLVNPLDHHYDFSPLMTKNGHVSNSLFSK